MYVRSIFFSVDLFFRFLALINHTFNALLWMRMFNTLLSQCIGAGSNPFLVCTPYTYSGELLTLLVTLIPYITFSLFHLLTFTRTTILPSIKPASQNADGTSTPAGGEMSKSIQKWVKQNYDVAMRFVSYAEVVIFVRVLIGAMLLRNSLLAPLFYAHFLRLRFYMSSFTRAALQHVRAELDQITQCSSCPPSVRKGYLMLTDLVTRYASTVLSINRNQPEASSAASSRPYASTSSPADPTKLKTR